MAVPGIKVQTDNISMLNKWHILYNDKMKAKKLLEEHDKLVFEVQEDEN
jgi:DNA polymerase I-like protein with 3'-5' exonuclease and polymerase domains